MIWWMKINTDQGRHVGKKGKRGWEIRKVSGTKQRTTRSRAKDPQRSECVLLHKPLFGHHNTERLISSG